MHYVNAPHCYIRCTQPILLAYSKTVRFHCLFVCRDESASASYYYKSEDMRTNAIPSWIKFKVIGLGPGHYPARSKQVGVINHSVMDTVFSFIF
jgi:hypothetical protein